MVINARAGPDPAPALHHAIFEMPRVLVLRRVIEPPGIRQREILNLSDDVGDSVAVSF